MLRRRFEGGTKVSKEVRQEHFGKRMRARLLELKLASEKDLEGCNPDIFDEIMLRQGVEFLPRIYKEFLEEMGGNAGQLFLGSDYDCYAVYNLKASHIEDIERFSSPFRMPADAFVFLSHQGYVFYYFHTAEHDENPPVYMNYEADDTSVKYKESLSQFFEEAIDEIARLHGQ